MPMRPRDYGVPVVVVLDASTGKSRLLLQAIEDYGVDEAAETRRSGVGTKLGLRFTSCGASAGISSGPSAGGAGSSALVSVAAYFAVSLCSSV